jgi:hypothetical protein
MNTLLLSCCLMLAGALLAAPPPGGGGKGAAWRSNATVAAPVVYEWLFDCEDTGASDATDITRPIATNMTSVGSALGSYLIITNGSSVTSTIRVEVDTAVKARGTRSLRTDYTTDFTYIEWTMNQSNAVMSFGFAFYLDSTWTGSTFNSYNLFVITSATGEFMNCNLFDGTPFEFGLQTFAGLSTAITGFSNQTWYWCTMKWDQGGDATMSIYDYVSGGLGALKGTKTMALQADYPQFLEFGREDNHDVFNSGAWIHFDDLICDYQGAFPLTAP